MDAKRVAGLLAPILALLPACGLLGIGDSEKEIANDLVAKTDEIRSEIQSYLAVGQNTPELTTPQQWREFFDDGARRVAKLRSVHDEWSALFDRAIDAGLAESSGVPLEKLREYQSLTRQWIDDQEEQLRGTRTCFGEGYFLTESAARCMAALTTDRGPSWQATADRLNQLAREIFG